MKSGNKKTLYQTMIKGDDGYGSTFMYSKGNVTPSKKTAVGRIKEGMKGYVQDINTKDIVFQNIHSGLQVVGL